MTKTTHWIKQLAEATKPAYLLIADLIAEDVRTGRLTVRDQLPTLRDLATALNLNYTTVARGYAEARKRGLIDSRAGSGTFIRGQAPSMPLRGGSGAEMTMNLPPEPQDAALITRLHESAALALAKGNFYELMRYQDFGGTAEDRDVAAQWLRPWLHESRVENVLVCPGIHSVLTALVSQLARPGEAICVESLTYPGIKAIAAQLGVKLLPLPLDEDGPSASAFEHACKNLHPKALYINPTMLNPTTTTTSRARREALADIALHHSVPIIEDDAYGMLSRQSLKTLAQLAPDLTYYISGFSKCFGAGLRTAYVSAPNARLAQRLAGAMRATTVMASPVTNAIATQAVQDGTAAAMLNAIRSEGLARQALADEHLAGRGHLAQPEGFHLWLPVEESWSVVEFASYLRTQGVGVVASAAFSTDADPPNAVRVCLGGPMTLQECDVALRLIADTLDHPRHPHATVM
ncbi:PLP-dependent aminotransferase family protein [Uliginosibacterium sp. H3]|uniref:PLP-dependent aminotransferase family protein n=1 Tax=Uliginosibacterium silvisoli TaxID=3114758 RepID=A0ABU6K3F6_9RHOO|nr:PLP-dependent aminotransferase family protein [Uliginosibacterium sp. H3]